MLAHKSVLMFFTRVFTVLFSFISLYFIAHYMDSTSLGSLDMQTSLLDFFASSIEGKDLGKCVERRVRITTV